MADYKNMYLTMARETEKAIALLIAAQRRCEEIYMDTPEQNIVPLKQSKDKEPD